MQAKDLEYLIELGLKGNHLLFEDELVREVLRSDEKDLVTMGEKNIEEVSTCFYKVLSAPNIFEARQAIFNMPYNIQKVLAFIYFKLIDLSPEESRLTIH